MDNDLVDTVLVSMLNKGVLPYGEGRLFFVQDQG